MKIFPAIDLFGGKAVRLYKGNYNEMTVYSDNPVEIALDFKKAGAEYMHVVDLEGAKTGDTPNLNTISKLVKESGLFVEVGGGIRSIEVIKKYLSIGVQRVILGTAAVTDREFLKEAIREFGHHIAVGVDIKDGKVAIKGWLEKSEYDCYDFCAKMQALGVKTLICTDISKDGAMQGTNRELYKELSSRFSLDITASGGVSSLDDIIALRKLDLYGAIIGKAYYIGAIDLEKAVEIAK